MLETNITLRKIPSFYVSPNYNSTFNVECMKRMIYAHVIIRKIQWLWGKKNNVLNIQIFFFANAIIKIKRNLREGEAELSIELMATIAFLMYETR